MRLPLMNVCFLCIAVLELCRCSAPAGQQKGMFVYNEKTKTIDLLFKGHVIASRAEIWIKTKDSTIQKFPVSLRNGRVYASLGTFGTYTETLETINENTSGGRIALNVTTDAPFMVQCPFFFPKLKEGKPYFMIPGFLYGTNNLKTSDGKQPKFDYGGSVGWPVSSLFYCRADRSTHPGVITIKDSTVMMIGIQEKVDSVTLIPADKWSPGYLYNGLMLSSAAKEYDMTGFQIGYENAPKRYSWVEVDPVIPKSEMYCCGWIERQAGKSLRTASFYYLNATNAITDYGKALEACYNRIHQLPLKRSTRQEALHKISDAIVKYAWNADFKYFVLTDDKNGNIGDIGWTGGMQVAYPLLKSALKTRDSLSRNVALQYINNLCNGKAMNKKAGLLFEEFRKGKWEVTGWWGVRKDCFNFGDKPLHSAYLNGQASYYLLKACELIKNHPPEWLSTAETVLKTALANQQPDGSYPCFFDPNTGKGVNYDGFQSCWFVPGMALLYKQTHDPLYLKSAERAIRYYHQFHLRGELYGTPMDTHLATDEEGNLSFIVAAAELHKITHAPAYLEMGMDGLNWEYSWKFAFNTAHSTQPLKRMNWSSAGGSITSSHNVSIHQMGNLVAGEMYYFYTQTQNPYIASRLKDVCIWGLGTYNTKDKDFGFGKTGEATEQFFYTDGLVLPWHTAWDGGVWEASLSWASACVLLSCAEDIPDVYFGE